MGRVSQEKFERAPSTAFPLPIILQRFWIAIVAFTVLAWGISAFCWRILHLRYPYTWPLDPRQFSFGDFTIFAGCFPQLPHFPEVCGQHIAYPAPAAMIYQLFYLLPSPLHMFLGTGLGIFLIAAFFFARALIRRGIASSTAWAFTGTVLACAYPILFVMDRANIEVFLWLLVALGVWAYMRGGWALAATLFGVAASMKFYPAVFLGLLLAKKRYKEFFFGIFIVILTTVLSLWILGPTIQIANTEISRGLHSFGAGYISKIQAAGLGFDHSLFSIIKASVSDRDYHVYATLYFPLAALAGVVLFFWRICRLPRINQVLALTIAAVLLPPISYEYTLIHLYIPWALLTLYAVGSGDASRNFIRIPGVGFCFACFTFLLTPQSYFIVHSIRFTGQLKALVLVALFVAALRYPFEEATQQQEIST